MQGVEARISAHRRSCNFPRRPPERMRRGKVEEANRVRRKHWRFHMPPRQPALPEGTDHIVAGASGNSDGQEGGGFVASAGGSSGTDRLVSQVKDQVTSLRGQAADRVRGFADDGKGRVTGLLENVSEVINDAARSVDERLGEDYGDYAH